MEMQNFKTVIAISNSMEYLNCEIYYKDEIVAEISQEQGPLLLQVYSPQTSDFWEFDFYQFQSILEVAKQRLVG